jgi:hypothetical protein
MLRMDAVTATSPRHGVAMLRMDGERSEAIVRSLPGEGAVHGNA